MHILITGSAGFIGFHLSKKFLSKGYRVVGIDNLNHYYDVNLKKKRLSILRKYKNFLFHKIDLTDGKKIKKIFDKYKIETVINLAAQAGVRYSIENPNAYIKSNLEGFFNILEHSKNYKVKKFFYASSSSVYGSNKKLPFSEEDIVKNPISLYAATKLSNEILSESYSKMFKMNIVGLRFFTVYGPWGRPDMALFKFTEKILSNKKLEVYNYGKMLRDFTYVDDITESIFRLFKIKKLLKHEIFNIGNNSPVKLMDFILMIEKVIGVKGKYKFLPLQNGDVKSTYSDSKKLFRTIKFKPSTKLMDGIKSFVRWYLKNYQR
jgi:UDP-glucuronate 4-epimerase